MERQATSPMIATIVMIVIAITATFLVMNYSSAGSTEEKAAYRLDFVSAHQVKPVSVENAGWQIALIISNNGNREEIINEIFVNDKLVEEIGLIHGDELSTGLSIGTSVPEDGVIISPGTSVTIYVWIGSELFDNGSQLTIELNYPNQIQYRKTTTLN